MRAEDEKFQLIQQLYESGQAESFFRQAVDIMNLNQLEFDGPIVNSINSLFEALSDIFSYRISEANNRENRINDFVKTFIVSLFCCIQKNVNVYSENVDLCFISLFKNEKISLAILFCVLDTCSNGQYWLWDKPIGNTIIDSSTFKEADAVFYHRVLRESGKEAIFFREKEISSILFFWEKRDEQAYSKFMDKVVTDINLALRIQVCVYPVWVMGGNNKWELNNGIRRYKTPDNIQRMYLFLRRGAKGLIQVEREKVAAFILCSQQSHSFEEMPRVEQYLEELCKISDKKK